MKAILMSIKPQWVAKILNGEKTIEVRKRFPSDYVGWVYIYCTKGKPYIKECDHFRYVGNYKIANKGYYLNGKVVARFWCDRVGEIYFGASALERKRTVDWICNDIFSFEKEACLTQEDLDKYLGNVKHSPQGYAIHITKLEIFDKPKEISEFGIKVFPHRKDNLMTRYLTRAPQSWCYIEV